MARIPLLTVEQIKARADILDIVSEFVQLKRCGRNYFGLCPFHEEKTPSFSVNPSMAIFHCFGCGKGGNAISFIMEYEKIGYVEALKRLADRYGIEIEWEEGDTSRRGEAELLYELHDIANNFYNRQLSSEKGAEAPGTRGRSRRARSFSQSSQRRPRQIRSQNARSSGEAASGHLILCP